MSTPSTLTMGTQEKEPGHEGPDSTSLTTNDDGKLTGEETSVRESTVPDRVGPPMGSHLPGASRLTDCTLVSSDRRCGIPPVE